MLRINARTFIKFLSPQLINYKLFCGIFTKKYYLHIDTRSFIFLIYYFIGVVYINVFIETLGQAFFKYFCIYRGRLKEGGRHIFNALRYWKKQINCQKMSIFLQNTCFLWVKKCQFFSKTRVFFEHFFVFEFWKRKGCWRALKEYIRRRRGGRGSNRTEKVEMGVRT